VTVCHTYEIAFKHHYTCTACGYIYGRHSKSIDTEATRCGRCGTGRLALTAAAEAAASAAGAGAAGAGAFARQQPPPRTPSAYQAFVAEHRKAVAASLPAGSASSQQVMVALGQLWQQRKAATTASKDGIGRDTASASVGVGAVGGSVEPLGAGKDEEEVLAARLLAM